LYFYPKNMRISIFLLILCVLCSCKKCKESTPTPPIPPPLCGDNYTQITEDSCACQFPNVEWYKTCRKLRKNEYFGIMDGCFCADTVFLWVFDSLPNGDLRTRMNDDNIEATPVGGQSDWKLVHGQSSDYYEGGIGICQNAPLYKRYIIAKWKGPDTILLDVRYQYFNNFDNPFVDSCRAILIHR
jgi:hypothetical protein